MSFAPPSNAENSAIRPGNGWVSCGWLALDEWMQRTGKRYKPTADALGVSTSTLTAWKHGRPPAELHLARITALASIDKDAWTWWVTAETTPRPEEAPESGEQPVTPAALGTTREELEDIAARCKALARSAGLSPREQAVLEGQRRAAMSELRRMDESAELEDHPDFESFLDDIIGATCDVLRARGFTDPVIKSEIAQALRRRGESRERRAA